jgi:hypothetical protein
MSPATDRTDNPDSSTEWTCVRKKAYPDEKTAKRVANTMRNERGADVVHYGCTRCGRYHIGRRPA